MQASETCFTTDKYISILKQHRTGNMGMTEDKLTKIDLILLYLLINVIK